MIIISLGGAGFCQSTVGMGQDLQQIHHADIGNLPWVKKTREKANDIGYLDLTPKLAAKSRFSSSQFPTP